MSTKLPPLPGARRPPPPPPPPPVDEEDRPPAAELAETPHRLSHRVAGLNCPNCAGNLEIETGLRVVECPYCATALLVKSEIGTRRLAVAPQIGAAKARELARGWLSRGLSKDRRLARDAEVREAFLCFLPFFRVEGDAVGIALGTELRRRTVGSGKNRRVETYEVDVERKVERTLDKTYPAVNVAEWGIQRVDLKGDPLLPLDAEELSRQGMVFPATGSERDVMASALAAFRRSADPATALHKVRFRFLETLRERLTVIYYPLWVVRYHFNDRAYQILVDGEDGSLAYGKAPGNDFFRAVMLVATEALVLFVGTTIVQMVGVDLGGLAILGALGAAAMAWGWRHFRYGGVVVEGSGTTPEPSLKETLVAAGKSGSARAALRSFGRRGTLGGRR